MHIPEKYRDRYDRLALSHPWMREMRDEDDRDVRDARIAKLLRQRDELKRKLEIADTIERDYVSREYHCKTVDENARLLAKALDDRDEWRAKAEAKSAKRAAAVERLRNCFYTSDSDLMRAMLNWGHEPHTGDDSRFALIHLLADDDANDDSAPETGVSAGYADANDGKPTANPRQSDGMDSREKLEADVLKFSQVYYASHLLVYDKVIELLDRQDAITCAERDRHWMEIVGANANANVELKRQIDELTVRAVGAEQEADELTAIVDRLTYDRDELQSAYDELTRIAAELCRACGFEMCDAAGEEVRDD